MAESHLIPLSYLFAARDLGAIQISEDALSKLLVEQVSGFVTEQIDEASRGVIEAEGYDDNLDQIVHDAWSVANRQTSRETSLRLAVQEEISLGLPGLAGIDLVIPIDQPGGLTAKLALDDPSSPVLTCTVAVRMRFASSLLRPMLKRGAAYVEDSGALLEADLGRTAVRIDAQRVDFDANVAITIERPFAIAGTDIVIDAPSLGAAPADRVIDTPSLGAVKLLIDTSGEDPCLSLTWPEPNVNRLLRALAPELRDTGPPVAAQLTMRMILGDPIRELRLEWQLPSERELILPGARVTLPDTTTLIVALSAAAGGPLSRLSVALQLPKAQPLKARSTFAWGRGDERELQNNADRAAPPVPWLFEIGLTPNEAETILLLDVGPAGLRFLRRLDAPEGAAPIVPCRPLPLAQTSSLAATAWSFAFAINQAALQLPFLKSQSLGQFLTVRAALEQATLDLPARRFKLPVLIGLQIGSLKLESDVLFSFDWETLALDVDHGDGVELTSTRSELRAGPYLGLDWIFQGKLLDDGRYHYFTLATANYDYAVHQAPGSTFEVRYDKISREPIGFRVSDFVLRAKGISMRAEVLGDPVRLLGIDTKFRFSASGFTITDNAISDFTLAGGGPLPPDLVGEAEVSIALSFGQLDGGMTLKSGAAKLKTGKQLSCKSTRFEFSVDELGLKFVNDGRFHLYFTITGSAQFKLAPGDEREGLLSYLPNIKIDLVEAPLCGDPQVLAQHIKFLVSLPKPVSFSLLGCFEMELRGIGFIPQAEFFDGDAAMWISGQIKFAHGGEGDTANNDTDYHSLYIGLPERGKILPRIKLEQIVVDVQMGDAFKLYAVVKFYDSPTEKGFDGEGELRISGLPTLRAAFAFLRVRREADNAWVRAWFIYAEAGELSLTIPVVQIYIREIGLGLGYRYTLAMIKAVDREPDARKLLKELDKLSRTQGNLSKRDSWERDIEQPDQSPRWTLVLRAMISQTSASGPYTLNRSAEEGLACLFLLDAVISIRSDLTFLMSARGWLNTNYVDFCDDDDELRSRPTLTAYILLAPAQKRLIMRAASNPNGYIGKHPNWSDFVKTAIKSVQFSATLLVEPGLVQLDLGWPNKLAWSATLGPIAVAINGGFIFRVSTRDLVIGVSYLARGRMAIAAGVSAGIAGVRVSANAEVAYGMRFIGVLSLIDPADASRFYGAVGFEMQVALSFELWIKFLFVKVSFRLSIAVLIAAALEVGIPGLAAPGVRGTATLGIRAMGRTFRLDVKLAVNEDAVQQALDRTQEYLRMGLDSSDEEGPPEPVPGTTRPEFQGGALGAAIERLGSAPLGAAPQEDGAAIAAPHYTVFAIRNGEGQLRDRPDPEGWSYLVLFPRGAALPASAPAEDHAGAPQRGFLPIPLAEGYWDGDAPPPGYADFELDMRQITPPDGFQLHQYVPGVGWQPRDLREPIRWAAGWQAQVVAGATPSGEGGAAAVRRATSLRGYMGAAFVEGPRDPALPPGEQPLDDPRVQNPADSDFEAAVRGAFEQLRASPFFKHDPSLPYDAAMARAYQPDTSIYGQGGQISDPQLIAKEQGADQLRGLILHDIIADLRDHLAGRPSGDPAGSLAFQMGLVFRYKGAEPEWLRCGDGLPAEQRPRIRQRSGPELTTPDGPTRRLWLFNPPSTSFLAHPPAFSKVRHFSSAATIAITWDLIWEHMPEGCLGAQVEPEEHLAAYRVLRRPLDSNESSATYTVKAAQVLNRVTSPAGGDLLQVLRPRFQIIDQFSQDSEADLAALPLTGRSYLYTITPVDYAGNPGRPLTLVATRLPDRPPVVPADAQLRLVYRLSRRELEAAEADTATLPALLPPDHLAVAWTEPPPRPNTPQVPVQRYRLLFRRSGTLPIGSYGLDSQTRRGREALPPTGSVRPLPGDLRVDLPQPVDEEGQRVTRLGRDELVAAGLFPAGTDPRWQPDAWEIFIQAIGVNGVPSALAPVQYLLTVARPGALRPYTPLVSGELQEERQPADLEFLPRPTRLPPLIAGARPQAGLQPALPPEDVQARMGMAGVPMPSPADPRFTGAMTLSYQLHPEEIRAVRMRWNQGPSDQPDYPLDLNAGYQLFELDIDAHTGATFQDADRLADALRWQQELRLVPGADLPLIPNTTLDTSRWEAWYPSAVLRRVYGADAEPNGSQRTRTPWYSWRESTLEWPPALAGAAPASGRQPHIFLQRLIDRLGGVLLVIDLSQDQAALEALVKQLDGRQWPAGSRLHQELAAFFTRLGTVNGDPPSDPAAPPPFTPAVYPLRPGAEWRLEPPRDQARVIYERLDGVVVRGEQLRVLVWEKRLYVTIASPYTVDLQAVPPVQAAKVTDFFAATPAQADPYGWAALQQMGLSVALILRDAVAGGPISAQEAQLALKRTLDELLGALPAYIRYVHFEQLVQPGRSIALLPPLEGSAPPAGPQVGADALLALFQVSLRPALRQLRRYAQRVISGPAGGRCDLVLTLRPGQSYSMILRAEPTPAQRGAAASTSGQVDLEGPASGQAEPQRQAIRLPLSGRLTLLLRGESIPEVQVALPLTAEHEQKLSALLTPLLPEGTALSAYYTFSEQPSPQISVRQPLAGLLGDPADRRRAERRLAEELGDAALATLLLTLDPGASVALSPLDGPAADFAVPPTLPREIATAGTALQAHWNALRSYLGAAGVAESLPSAEPGIAALLPDVLAWTQRFFDHGGAVTWPTDAAAPSDPSQGPLATTASGPWLASAYPRSGAPAYASPDAGGRVAYNHLIGDKWGHAYRYYVQPYGRYDRLMGSLREGRLYLLDDAVADGYLPPVPLRPDPQAGGLDVVLDRIQPVAPPVVLASGRLDEPGSPDRPAPPGRTWEVIVAQHPEQALVERNQTLVRRLAFRQIAFTLLRRFAYLEWAEQILKLDSPEALDQIRFVANYPASPPALPGPYPAQADHLDLAELARVGAGAEERERRAADLRSLDLPLRLPAFQQGALVLQWEGLPFYYEHRLLLVAQAAQRVSRSIELTQRDFSYRSPEAQAASAGVGGSYALPADRFGPLPAAPADTPVALRFGPLPAAPAGTPVALHARELRIALARLWDSLPADARRAWPDENPGEAPYALPRTLSSLPDPEVIYQIIETFSGNIEVQAEIFFDEDLGAYAVRQLGQRFLIAGSPTITPALGELGDADFALNVVGYQVLAEGLATELPAASPREFLRPIAASHPDTVARLGVEEGQLLIAGGVLSRADRDALIAPRAAPPPPDPAPDQPPAMLPPLIEHPADQAAIDAIYQLWQIEEPLSEPAEQELPGFVALPIAYDLALVWDGPMSAAEATALQAVRADEALDAALGRLIAAARSASDGLLLREPIDVPAAELPAGLPPELSAEGDPDRGLLTALVWRGPLSAAQLEALSPRQPQGEVAMAIRRLARAARAATLALITRERATLGLEQPLPNLSDLPAETRALLTRLRFPADAVTRRYPDLFWDGLLFDDQKLALEQAVAPWFGLARFRSAFTRLMELLEQRPLLYRFSEPGRPRKAEIDQFPTLRSRLTVVTTQGEAPRQELQWGGPAPDDAQRAALQAIVAQAADALPADAAFRNAVKALLASYNAAYEVALPRPAPPPAEGEPPPPPPPPPRPTLPVDPALQPLADLLTILPEAPAEPPAGSWYRLRWGGPAPSDAQRSLLQSYAWPEALAQGVRALLAAIDATRRAPLPAAPWRPYQENLPREVRDEQGEPIPSSSVAAQLTITLTELRWHGRVHNQAQHTSLLKLLVHGYEPELSAALRGFITTLEGSAKATLDLPVRPSQADLPEGPRERLTLGRARISYHGLMTLEEGRELRGHFPRQPDRSAIERLYRSSQAQGMRGRALSVRARRGSAAPGPVVPLLPTSLEEPA